MTHGTYAIVLTCDRPELLDRCLEAIYPQVELTVIIDNGLEQKAQSPRFRPMPYILIREPQKPPNLSRFWNVGIQETERRAQVMGHETWDVAFLCDDAIVHPEWFQEVSRTMRDHGAAAASTHSAVPVTQPILKTVKDSDIWNRMCPWAFVMRGEAGVRADEDLKWWWGDTDLDFKARGAGGMVIAPGSVVINERVGEYTNSHAHLAEQAGRDGETFASKWGFRPW